MERFCGAICKALVLGPGLGRPSVCFIEHDGKALEYAGTNVAAVQGIISSSIVGEIKVDLSRKGNGGRRVLVRLKGVVPADV